VVTQRIANPCTKIAKAFTDSRLAKGSLAEYPGEVPTTLDEAYAIQDAAIALWPHKIAGWKIGGIGGSYAEEFGQTKLAGPVFENQIYRDCETPIDMPVFKDGFAAIEDEIVFIVSKDAPADKLDWTACLLPGVHQSYSGDISTISCTGVADIDLKLVPEA